MGDGKGDLRRACPRPLSRKHGASPDTVDVVVDPARHRGKPARAGAGERPASDAWTPRNLDDDESSLDESVDHAGGKGRVDAAARVERPIAVSGEQNRSANQRSAAPHEDRRRPVMPGTRPLP